MKVVHLFQQFHPVRLLQLQIRQQNVYCRMFQVLQRSASSAVATATAFVPHCSETVAQVSRIDRSSSTIRTFIGTTSRRTAASSLMVGILKDASWRSPLH